MPIGIAVLGVAGAFVTTSMKSTSSLADQPGYRFLNAANPCVMVKECTTDGTVICKSGTITLWGKESEDLAHPCNVQLYERQ